jgi:hypothetical protein
MTAANCPACGAPVKFRFSSAVQTVCEYCRSILVRHDVNLDKVGQAADVPDNASPIQLGTDGGFRNRAFVVVGRIVYEYELGGWNEWHLAFADGGTGWLSDAQLEYAVTVQVKPPAPLPRRDQVERGKRFDWKGAVYEVTSKTMARYRTVEGDLPFEYWGKDTVPFIDLRTSDERFATIDYSEEPPLLFLGEAVEFDELKLKGLRDFEGWQR